MVKSPNVKRRLLGVLTLFLAILVVTAGPVYAQRRTCTIAFTGGTQVSDPLIGQGSLTFRATFGDPVTPLDVVNIQVKTVTGQWQWLDQPDGPKSIFTAEFPSGRFCPNPPVMVATVSPVGDPDENGNYKEYDITITPYRDCQCCIRIPQDQVFTANGDGNEASNEACADYDEAPRVLITRVDSVGSIADGAPDSNDPTLYYLCEFTEPVEDFGYGDVVTSAPSEPGAAGGTKTAVVTGSGEPGAGGTIYYIGVSGMTYSGTVQARCNAGAAVAVGGAGQANWPEEACSLNITNYDGTPPDWLTVTIPSGLPQPPQYSGTYTTSNTRIDIAGSAHDDVGIAAMTGAPYSGAVTWTNDRGGSGECLTSRIRMAVTGPSVNTTPGGGPVTYTVTYSGQSAITLSASDVSLNTTGTATAGTITVTGAGNTRTITLSDISGSGTIGISIRAGTASASNGVKALPSGPCGVFSVGTPATPSLVISGPSAPITTTGGPISYTVTYTGATAVTLTAADIILNRTGTANGTVSVSGTGTATRTVTISGITGYGTLGISIAAGTATDGTNLAQAAGPSATFDVGIKSTGVTYAWMANGIYLKPGRNRITIAAHDAAGNELSYVLTVNCTNSYMSETVDDAELVSVGTYSSIAVDGSGNPRIAYYQAVDPAHGYLKYAAWNGQAWSKEFVDGNAPGVPADDVGRFTSIKIDAAGNPHISYYDTTNTNLMYAVWRSGAWQIQTVDGASTPTDAVGQYSSLALYNGLPRIAYYDAGGKRLKYASYDGTTWTKSVVDSSADVGQYASLALDPTNGYPRISYYDATNKDLKYAAWDGATWQISTVDSAGDVGMYSSLALDPITRLPRISYYDATAGAGDLKYAAWTGSEWTFSTVDSANDVGQYCSLALDPTTGAPRIAYYDATATALDLKLAEASDPLNPVWTTSVLDDGVSENGTSTYDVGQYCSLALDASGNAHISYFDNTTGAKNLKYIFRATGPTCFVDALDSSPTNASPLTFRITFSSSVTGFAANKVNVVGGTAGALTEIAPMDGTTYQLLVTPTGDGTVSVSVPSGAARAGSRENQPSNTATVVVDRTSPDVTINQEYIQRDPTNASVIRFAVVFTEPVVGFTSSDVAVGGSAAGSKSVTVKGQGSHYLLEITGTTSAGTVIPRIPAGVAADAAGNLNTASVSTDNTVWWDGIPPTCTINQADDQADPTNSSTIYFTAVFSEPVVGFDSPSDVIVDGSASFTGANGASTLQVTITPADDPDAFGHHKVYRVGVSGMQTKGTVTCTIPAGAASDCEPSTGRAINPNLPSTSTDNVVTYDGTPVTCTINRKSDQPDPTNNLPIKFTAQFSKEVTGFAAADVNLTGTADLTAATVTVTGSGANYTVEVDGIAIPAGQTAPVTLIANIPAGVVQDAAGNTNLAATFEDNSVLFDNVGPAVTVNQAAGQSDSTPDSPVHFTAVFSEPVSGFAPEDLMLFGTSSDPVVLSPISIRPDGTFAPDTVTANHGDTVRWRNDGSDPFTLRINNAAGETVAVLDVPVGDTVSFTAFWGAGTYTFQKDTDVPPAVGTVTLAPVLTATVTEIPPNDGTTYDVAVSGMVVPGTVTASVREGTVTDALGNLNTASTSTDNSVVYFDERCALTLVSIPDNNPNGAVSPLDLSRFSGTITDLNVKLTIYHGYVGDLTAYLIGPDGTQVPLFSHVGGNGSNFIDTVLDDEASQSIAAGPRAPFTGTFKPLGRLSAFDGKSITGQWLLKVVDDHSGVTGTIQNWCLRAVIEDTDKPVCTITAPAPRTNASPIDFAITFNEPVSELTLDEITVTGGTPGVLSGDVSEYTLPVTPAGDGVVTVTVNAGAVFDTCGNFNDAASGSCISDLTCPTAVITNVTPSPTHLTTIEFRVVFSEPVVGFAAEDITLSGTAGATTKTVIDSGNGTDYLLVVSGMTGAGTVTVSLNAGSVLDAAGNLNCLNPPNDTCTVQFVGVLCTVTPPSSPTRTSPIEFQIQFTVPVTGLTKDKITVTGGTALSLEVVGTTDKYKLKVVPDTSGPIVVTCQVPAGAAKDASGNPNAPSNVASVTYDSSRVSVAVNQADGQADPTNTGPILFKAVFSKEVADFAADDVTVSGTAGGTKTIAIDPATGPAAEYTIAVSGMTTPGTVIVSIPADKVHDSAGNGNDASLSNDNVVLFDAQRPTVTINQASSQPDPTNQSTVRFTAVFSERVVGFDATDVVVTVSPSATPTITVNNPSGDQMTYTIVVSGLTTAQGGVLSCTVTASIPADVCFDAAGNANQASTSTDNQVTIDGGAPAVSICQASGQSDPTNVSPIAFQVQFSEPVVGFTADDVVISGTAGGTITKTVRDDGGGNYTVFVSGMTCPAGSTLPGTVIAMIPAGAAADLAGNPSLSSDRLPCDNQVSFDNRGPAVSVAQASGQPDSTWANEAKFTVTFGEPVTDFTAEDVVLGGSVGFAGDPIVTVAGQGGGNTVFEVTVKGFDYDKPGNVTVSVPAGVAFDGAGNGNLASTSTDNSVVFFPEQCSTDTLKDIPDGDPNGVTSVLDLSGFSGRVLDVDVVVDLVHEYDEDLKATLISPAGTRVLLFQGVGGSGRNFTATLLADEAPTSIAAGTAPFSDSAGYRPMSPLSALKNENITGQWKLELIDSNPGSTGRLISWCLRISIADAEPPTAVITPPSGPTCLTPLEFGVTFSEPVIGLSVDRFVVVGGTATALTGSGADYVLQVEPAGDVKVEVTLPARAAHDTCGNYNADPAKASFTYDGPPQVTIDKADTQPDPTAVAPVNFTVFFHDSTGAAKAVTGFEAGDVLVTGTAFGPGATPLVTVTGSGATYNVAVGGMDRSGTVVASVPAGVAASANGCLNLASTSTDNVVDYDITPVEATINVAPGQADPTTVQPINFVAHFGKPVSDFAASDVVVTGTAGGTKTVSITGSGTDYTVRVSGLTSSGYVEVSIPAGVVHDALGNPNTASTSTKNRVWFDDLTNPKVTVTPAAGQPDPAKDEPINFTVTFNKFVTGFGDDPSDVLVGGTAFGPGAVKNVEFAEENGSWNVAVSGMTVPGTVTLSVPAGVACDPAGKCNDASAVAQVIFDNERPSVTINQAASQEDPTFQSVINFTVEFSEPVSDFSDADVTITGTAFGPGSVKTAVVTGGPAVYNVAVSGMNTAGTVFATIPEDAAFDDAGNGNLASTSTDNAVTYDMPPLVTINQAATQRDPTSASPIVFTVVFSEPVIGFGPKSVLVTGTAFGIGATKTVVIKGIGPTYTVEVSGMNQSGTVAAEIPSGVVRDYSGIYNLASTSTDNVVTLDIDRPTVTVEKAADQADPTKDAVINFTAVFSKPVVDFTEDKVTIAGSAFGPGATKVVTITGVGTEYNIAVSGMNVTGTVTASIGEGRVHDAVGNGNLASTSVDNVVDYDITGPTVTVNKASGQSDPTNTSPVNFTVVFSEPVTDFTSEDITIEGTAGATTAVVSGAGTTYNVAVSGMTSPGTVIVSVAAGVAHDSVGNPNSASTSTDNVVAFDDTALTVTVEQASAQGDPTKGSPINFTVVFSKPVSDFTSEDVTIGGDAGGTKNVTVTGSGTTYNVAVSGMNSTGTVIASIAAGKAHDAAGNANTASTSTDNVVTYDITPPTIAITKPTDQDSCVWNCDRFKIGGTAVDTVALATVTWRTAAGGESGICTGTTSQNTSWEWSASDIGIGSGDTIIVTATDAAGNTSSDSIDVTVTPALPAQGDWTGLAMVSVPIIPYDEDPKLVVGFTPNYWVCYDPVAAQYLQYPHTRTWFTPTSSVPGRGFWAWFRDTNTVTPSGIVPDQTREAVIHLYSGWNLIGQPFISAVPWTTTGIKVRKDSQEKTLSQARDAGWVRDYAWGWQPDASSSAGGAYYLVYDPTVIPGAVGEMKPWRAYWFRALVECDLVLPAP